jgi:dihydroorotate dehydrogenase (NAD+) catalytic subunit
MARISAQLGKLYMSSPLMLASGILGETGPSLLKAIKAGAGAVVTKSVGKAPRDGYPNPTFAEMNDGIINAIGLANPGIDEYLHELGSAVKGAKGVPIVGSIFGGEPEEFAQLSRAMEKGGAAAIEMNLGCPHAKGLGADIGSNPQFVKEFTAAVKAAVKIPVFVKITPNVTDITAIAQAVEDGGGDAVVAINTVRGMAIDADLARPVLSNKLGGLSGPAIKPVGLAAVWRIYDKIKIPIIGVGGIQSATDVAEYIMAGARAVQVGTAVWKDGVGVFGRINKDLEAFMKAHKYNSIADMVGVAHRA